MKISDLLKRLEKEDFYQDFIKENPDNYLSALLCILTKNEKEGDKIQLDFFIPSKKRLAYSEYPFIQMQYPEDEILEMKQLTNEEMAFGLDELWEIVENAKKDNDAFQVTSKIIGILKDNSWTLTCLDETMGMVKINLNSATGEVIKFNKGNLTDFMGFKKVE